MKSRKSIEVEEARHPTADMDGYWWELILGILLKTDLLPTKNLPLGSDPSITAGAPSYFTVELTARGVSLSNICVNASR